MKKISFLAAAFLASATLFAQGPKYGVKAGLNLSTLTGPGNADWRPGFHAGFLSHIHVTPAFSLQPEVVYSSQGAKYESANADQKLKLEYINVPILLQYNFDNGFRLQGGPQIGFLVNAKAKIGDTDLGDVTDNYKTIDFSIPLGLSYLSYSGFGVDARYNLGITNVVDASSVNVRNSVIQLGVFYLFDHHHKAKSR